MMNLNAQTIRVVIVSLGALALIGSRVVYGGEEPAASRFTDGLLHTRVAIAPSDFVERRPSGELRVATTLDGIAMRVVFASEEDYRAAVGATGLVLDLHDLTAFVRDRNGDAQPVTGSLLEALRTSPRTICGDVTVRAMAEVGGVRIGVDFARLGDGGTSESLQSSQQGTASGGPRVLGENKYVNDVDKECDTFALGGCGGPNCTNKLFKWNGEVLILPGTCISWGPFYMWCSCNTKQTY